MLHLFAKKFVIFKIPKWFWVVCACAIGFFLLFPEVVSAQNPLQALYEDPESRKLLVTLQNWLNIALGTINMVLWPVILMIGGLMDNELIFGGQMGESLREIWVNMRNFVNVIFVLILIVIAIYNVLGLGEKGGPMAALQLKQIFPKFVVALLVVNFSFLGARVMLDFTNVLTKAVLALPVNISSVEKIKGDFTTTICSGQSKSLHRVMCDQTQTGKLNARAEQFFSSDNSNIALVMAVAFGKLPLQNLTKVGIEGLLQLGFNLIYGIVMFFIYGVAFIILFAVLLVRIPVLWVLIALSPLWAVMIVLPQLAQLAGGEGGLGQKFIKHATAPLIIGLFMSIGYIMIAALRNEPGISGGYFASLQLTDIDPNALVTGIGDLQEMLASIAVAAVVWVGAGTAAKGTVAEKFSDGLRGYVGALGSWAAQLPKYAPIIPTKEGGPKVSLAELGKTMDVIKGMPEDRTRPLIERRSPYDVVTKAKTAQDLGRGLRLEPGALRFELDGVKDALRRTLPDNKGLKEKLDKAKTEHDVIEAVYTTKANEKLNLPSRQDFADMVTNAQQKEVSYGVSEKLRRVPGEAPPVEATVQLSDDFKKALAGNADAMNRLTPNLKTLAADQTVRTAVREAEDRLPETAKDQLPVFQPGQEESATPQQIMDRMKLIVNLAAALTGPNDIDSALATQLTAQNLPYAFRQALKSEVTSPDTKRKLTAYLDSQ